MHGATLVRHAVGIFVHEHPKITHEPVAVMSRALGKSHTITEVGTSEAGITSSYCYSVKTTESYKAITGVTSFVKRQGKQSYL